MQTTTATTTNDLLTDRGVLEYKGFVAIPGQLVRVANDDTTVDVVRLYSIRVDGDNEVLATVRGLGAALRWIDDLEQELFG